MGNKKPIRYIVYAALTLFTCVFGLVVLIATPLLFENNTIFPNMSDSDFTFCYIFSAIICVVLVIFFFAQTYKVSLMTPLENNKWRFELYTSLVDIAVRKNKKKLKFWYNKNQLEQIEYLVKSASENIEFKLETKENKLVAFKVVDTLNQRVIFTGLFI